MSFDSYWTFVWSALMAAFLLWHLVSGRVPSSQTRRHRRDAPFLYWYQMVVLTTFFILAATLFHFGDRRAPIMFFAAILLSGIPSFLREGLPSLAKGNVPGSDDRVGRAFLSIALTLFQLLALIFIGWILVDIVRNPPW